VERETVPSFRDAQAAEVCAASSDGKCPEKGLSGLLFGPTVWGHSSLVSGCSGGGGAEREGARRARSGWNRVLLWIASTSSAMGE
jgi:hypothetical protein